MTTYTRGMRYGGTTIAAAAALLTLVAGCGDDGGEEEATSADSSAASGETSSTAKATPSESETPKGWDGEANCVAGGPLKQVTIKGYGESLSIRWTSPVIASAESQLFSVDVYSTDDKHAYQIGVKYVGGEPSATFVYDLYGDAGQTNLEDSSTGDATGVTALIDGADLPDLGDAFTWDAVLNVAGDDVARCPAGEKRFKFPFK